MPNKIQQGQVWRLITFSVLHNDMVHLLFNLFSQIIIGSFIEFRVKTIKTAILYVGSSYIKLKIP
jgi:membrane associated rhomboid family serine protease